jgi:dynein heavy chain 1
MGVAQWIPDFAARLAQLEKIAPLDSFIGVEVWLGGLFFPEAYVTATRQTVAQRNGWSLETLYLYLDIDEPDDTSAFVVEGASFVM